MWLHQQSVIHTVSVNLTSACTTLTGDSIAVVVATTAFVAIATLTDATLTNESIAIVAIVTTVTSIAWY